MLLSFYRSLVQFFFHRLGRQRRQASRMDIPAAAGISAAASLNALSTISPCHITGQNKPIAKMPVVIRKAMMYAIDPLFISFTSS